MLSFHDNLAHSTASDHRDRDVHKYVIPDSPDGLKRGPPLAVPSTGTTHHKVSTATMTTSALSTATYMYICISTQ
jgi:hypothetical protein